MFGTLIKRRERHLYVAIWFYIATWVTHWPCCTLSTAFELPVSILSLIPFLLVFRMFLVQWWYGHNAVGIFPNHTFTSA